MGGAYPARVWCRFENADGQIALDQLTTVDRPRLVKMLGKNSPAAQKEILSVLMELVTE